MSKERLEEIKDRVLIDKVYYKFIDSKGRWGKAYTLSDEDYRYLMQQAERVLELEQAILKQNKRHQKELERCRKAMRFYDDYGV